MHYFAQLGRSRGPSQSSYLVLSMSARQVWKALTSSEARSRSSIALFQHEYSDTNASWHRLISAAYLTIKSPRRLSCWRRGCPVVRRETAHKPEKGMMQERRNSARQVDHHLSSCDTRQDQDLIADHAKSGGWHLGRQRGARHQWQIPGSLQGLALSTSPSIRTGCPGYINNFTFKERFAAACQLVSIRSKVLLPGARHYSPSMTLAGDDLLVQTADPRSAL